MNHSSKRFVFLAFRLLGNSHFFNYSPSLSADEEFLAFPVGALKTFVPVPILIANVLLSAETPGDSNFWFHFLTAQ